MSLNTFLKLIPVPTCWCSKAFLKEAKPGFPQMFYFIYFLFIFLVSKHFKNRQYLNKIKNYIGRQSTGSMPLYPPRRPAALSKVPKVTYLRCPSKHVLFSLFVDRGFICLPWTLEESQYSVLQGQTLCTCTALC